MRYILLFLFCLTSATSIANEQKWEGIYQGTIGKAKIIVLLSNSDDSRYSYHLKPYDLGLVLEQDKSGLSFVESRKLGAVQDDLKGRGGALISGRWRLSESATGFTGNWSDAAGKKTLPIQLTPVFKPKTNEEHFSMTDRYHEIWARDVPFAPIQKTKNFGSVRTGEMKDTIFNLAFPRVLNHPDFSRIAPANAMLENEHRKAVASARQCQEYKARQNPDETKAGKANAAENHFKVTYTNPNLLSLTEAGSVFCGGAHPSNYARAMNFDLTKPEAMFGNAASDAGGDVLSDKNLGRIFRLETVKDRENFNQFWWNRWMKAAENKKADDPDCEDGFMNNSPMAERSADFHFTPKGLAVQRTDYAHAASVCLFQDYNPIVIPWAELKPWLRVDQKLLVDEVK